MHVHIYIHAHEHIKTDVLLILSPSVDFFRSCRRPRRANVSLWHLRISKNGTRNMNARGSYINTRWTTCPVKKFPSYTANSSRLRRSTATAQVGRQGGRERGDFVPMVWVFYRMWKSIILSTCPSTAHPTCFPFLIAIEDVVVGKRRGQYEEALSSDPLDYDTWFDYTRLEEGQGDLSFIREVYERAIANVPPVAEKRFWRRYIFLWVKYALFEELQAGEKERAREVYRACLSVIPHKLFTFGKIWVMAAHLEVCLCPAMPTPLFLFLTPYLPPSSTIALVVHLISPAFYSLPSHLPPSFLSPIPPFLSTSLPRSVEKICPPRGSFSDKPLVGVQEKSPSLRPTSSWSCN